MNAASSTFDEELARRTDLPYNTEVASASFRSLIAGMKVSHQVQQDGGL